MICFFRSCFAMHVLLFISSYIINIGSDDDIGFLLIHCWGYCLPYIQCIIPPPIVSFRLSKDLGDFLQYLRISASYSSCDGWFSYVLENNGY